MDAQTELMQYPNVHNVGWGEKRKNGVPTGELGWICYVDRKIDSAVISNTQACIPQTASDGAVTDVIEEPMQHALQGRQGCHTPLVKGGAQIQPQGARWVGTLGCIVKADGIYQGLSNWHVTTSGQFPRGHAICQPDSNNRNIIGRNTKWKDIDFRGGENLIDAALFDCKVNGKHMLEAVQVDIGAIKPDPVMEPQVGDEVQKFGRTTGYTVGRVEAIRSRTQVNYGSSGTALFVDQITIRGTRSGFSAGGDSGSLILDMSNRPYGLLFAGGGGTTIACRVYHVINILGVTFVSVRQMMKRGNLPLQMGV